ncbi:MAG: MFS transporter [Anaerolineales bacterium]|nr:MAG: MFS transporter [Anaerolineales bacterium]
MKLDWKKTFFIGFGFLGTMVLWQIYNAFVPIFLQTGHPGFLSSRDVFGFGLNATTTGAIMGIDNLAAIFILPMIGIWSDRIRTPIGRRYPFILSAAPLAALAFITIPLAVNLIKPENNGSLSGNTGPFSLFMIAIAIVLLAMAILRTPVISLMPDLIPSPLRSKANGVINFMGGVGFIIGSFGLALLFDINPLYPFLGAAGILILAVVLLFATTKEPAVEDLPHPGEHETSEEEQAVSALKGVSVVPQKYRKSLFALLGAIFLLFVAYEGIGAFFTSYAINELGVSEGFAPTLFGLAGVTFILFAIPAGFIGAKYGRRRTIIAGIILFGLDMLLGYFVTTSTQMGIVLAVSGIGWALINVNTLPMVIDTTDDGRLLGTYTGLYYLASQIGAAFAPLMMGSVIDLFGSNFRTIFLSGPAFFVLGLIAMTLVTRGEAHGSNPVEVQA